MSFHPVSKQHLTLQQGHHPNQPGKNAYLVTETRNTIDYKIGEMLTEEDVKALAIPFTVKGSK